MFKGQQGALSIRPVAPPLPPPVLPSGTDNVSIIQILTNSALPTRSAGQGKNVPSEKAFAGGPLKCPCSEQDLITVLNANDMKFNPFSFQHVDKRHKAHAGREEKKQTFQTSFSK